MKRNKFKKGFAVMLTGITMLGVTIFESLAFGSLTHEYVTDSSLKIISNLGDKETSTKEDFNKFYEKGYWEVFREYSKKPDDDEAQRAYLYHFSNWATDKNYMQEKDTTAKTKFISHYEEAVNKYKEGEVLESFQELGRSIHFLEDLNTAVHTVYETPQDAVLWVKTHTYFEGICDHIREDCVAEIYKSDLRFYEINSLETIAKSSAFLSADNFFLLYGDVSSITKKSLMKHDVKEMARNVILNAQRNVVGIFYKFYKEVTKT